MPKISARNSLVCSFTRGPIAGERVTFTSLPVSHTTTDTNIGRRAPCEMRLLVSTLLEVTKIQPGRCHTRPSIQQPFRRRLVENQRNVLMQLKERCRKR